MKRDNIFLMTAFTLLLFSGCAQKVGFEVLEPAQIDRMATVKKIAVSNFAHDRVGLSRKIEAKLSSFQIDGKNFFTVVSRNDLNKIIAEQKLQNSGLVNDENIVKIGQLIGAEAIISGNVSPATKQDTYFYEERVRCADSKCKSLVTYPVRCMKRVVGLSAELRVVDIAKGDIIYAQNLSKEESFKHCADDSRTLPSKSMAAQDLAERIADDFTYKLTPHYRHLNVVLLDDPDLDYTDMQERLLKNALKYIEQGRYDKAEKLLMRLIDSTGSKSYVPFYDLGVIKEAQGKYKEAKEYYGDADNLMIEPVDEISAAVLRINSLIAKRKKTMEQLNR
ncbi:CsgG/HfaB family protein [Sulfurimonas sp.]|uniref:CsgG/HfaB family protein n=1 Tax=Sulfurimonas sp. TaxID=2022749 RepID=UPI00261F3472|nr:CsgG/HfaB family protein [Sulfurimonas sp.]